MSLLVDYSKRRAEIDPESEIDISFSGQYDESASSWMSQDTFAHDHEDQEEQQEQAVDHCRRRRSPGKNKQLDFSSGSHGTASTADVSSSSCEDEEVCCDARPVSFRLKRRVSLGLGSSQQQQQDDVLEPLRLLCRRPEPRCHQPRRLKRSSDPLVVMRPKVEAPLRRNQTTGDAVMVQSSLQIDSWKKRQLSLLSAPAELATLSDRNLFQQPGRRGSYQHPPTNIECSAAAKAARSRGSWSHDVENARPSVPAKTLSMHDTRKNHLLRTTSAASRRLTKSHSLYQQQQQRKRLSSTAASKCMSLSQALPVQTNRRCPERLSLPKQQPPSPPPTSSKSTTRHQSFRMSRRGSIETTLRRTKSFSRRRGCIENLRSSSQHSLTGIAICPRPRSNSNNTNNNDFVTGSRIRRLSMDCNTMVVQ